MICIKEKKTHIKVIVVLSIIGVIGLFSFAVYMLVNSTKSLSNAAYPIKYSEYVDKYANEDNIDKALVYAVIQTESGFDASAQSGVGAVGLMQLMPETFEWMQYRDTGEITMETDALLDPETNIKYGCECLKFLLERYNNEQTAVAAYNAGFGQVDEWLTDSQYSTDGSSLINIPYPETAAYVEKVETAKSYYKEIV